ncbi:hypothetical protein RKD23_008036 [Streptomyces sp. SAI-170]
MARPVVRRLRVVGILCGRGSGCLAAGLLTIALLVGRLTGLGLGHGDLLPRVNGVRVGDGGQVVRLRLAAAGVEQLRPFGAVPELPFCDLRQVVAGVDRDDVRAVFAGRRQALTWLRTDACRGCGGLRCLTAFVVCRRAVVQLCAGARRGRLGHVQLPAGLQEAVRAEYGAVGHGAALVQFGDLLPALAVPQFPFGDAPQVLCGPRLAHRVGGAGGCCARRGRLGLLAPGGLGCLGLPGVAAGGGCRGGLGVKGECRTGRHKDEDAADQQGRGALRGAHPARRMPGAAPHLRGQLAYGAERELRPPGPPHGHEQQEEHTAGVLPVEQVQDVVVGGGPDDGGGPGEQQRQPGEGGGQDEQARHGLGDPAQGAARRRGGGAGGGAHQFPSAAVTPCRRVALPWPVTGREPIPATDRNFVS